MKRSGSSCFQLGMSAPFPVALPAQLWRRGEIIDLISGAFAAAPHESLMQIRRRVSLLIALFAFPCLSLAQQFGNLTQAYATADSQLSAAYKQALPRFTPRNQEMMRRAERAWLAFSESEKNLVISVVGGNPVPPESGREAIIGEVNIRRTHLQTFFASNSVPTALPDLLQRQEEALTKTYAECMSRLSEHDRQLLKDAERAWIAYRDADSASMLAAFGNPTIATAAAANLTSTREAQIADIIQVLKQKRAAVAKNTLQESPPSGVQNNAANPEDAKAIAEFKKQADAFLTAFLEKRDDPFFQGSDNFKSIPELPTEISNERLRLAARCVELSRILNADKLHNSASNEYEAIELLTSWSIFTKQLKEGNVDDAGGTIQKALGRKPKEVAAVYLPLWQAVERWRDVYLRVAPKFHEHTRKAKAFADLGKTSDAIKEYQAAFDIIENSAIPEKIKRIREESLGL